MLQYSTMYINFLYTIRNNDDLKKPGLHIGVIADIGVFKPLYEVAHGEIIFTFIKIIRLHQ